MAKKPKININATFDYTHLIPTICLRLETEVPELKPIFFGDSYNLKKKFLFLYSENLKPKSYSIPRFEKEKEKRKNKNKNFTDYGYTAKKPKININATFNPILI